MLLTKKQVQRFKDAYEYCFDTEITFIEAHIHLTQALSFMELVLEPMTQSELELLQNRRKELGYPPIDESLVTTLE